MRLYPAKVNFFYIFFQKNLHISKKSSIFAPDLEIVLITTLKKFTIMKTEKFILNELPKKTNELNLKTLKEKGVEMENYTLKAYQKGNVVCLYMGRPIKAYIFHYLNKYIVYTYVYEKPLIQEYYTYNEAIERFKEFINNMN